MVYIPFATSISRYVSYVATMLPFRAAGDYTSCLEAEDLVSQLGKSPRSGVSDLSKVDPGYQQYILSKAGEMTHFMAVIMGGGPHIKTFSSPTDLEGMWVSIISLVTNPVP